MKIIATVRHKVYLAEVSHTELEKFLNLYYNKLKELNVGQEIDLGKGYDHFRDTQAACSAVKDVVDKGAKFISTLTEGIAMMSRPLPAHKGGRGEESDL